MGSHVYLEFCMTMMKTATLLPETRKDYMWCVFVWTNLFMTDFILLLSMIQTTDMDEFASVGGPFVALALCTFKTFVLFGQKTDVRRILEDVRAICYKLTAEVPEHAHLLVKKERLLKNITTIFWIVIMTNFTSWVILTFLAAVFFGREFHQPIPMWYPFKVNTWYYYFLVVFHQLFLTIVLTPSYIMITVFFVSMIAMICAQMKILYLVLVSADKDNIRDKLRLCVEVHTAILKTGKDLEKLMSPIFLVEFPLFMSIVCQTFILIASGPITSYTTMKYMVFLTIFITELWLCCIFGNTLIDASTEFKMAAYNCPWYDMDESSKKCLLLTMLRSQKPLRLVIGQLYVVSLQTFTEVMKFCYSVFTLITQMK